MEPKLKFRPSDFSRWGTCTASPAAVAGVKVERKSYSDEGIIAHELHAICLSLDSNPREMIGESIEVKDIGSAIITGEMADCVEQSIEYINDQVPVGWSRFIEERVDLSWLIDGQTGVVDVAAFDPEEPTVLHILDYKHGKGVKVMAERHGELMLHALGVMRSLMDLKQRTKLKTIVLHILQPRIDHFDKWEISKGDLELFAVDARNRYIEAQDESKRKFVPSVEGCRFCPIKVDCRALRDSIYAKLLDDPNGIGMELKDPSRISDDELAEMYEWLDFISAWSGNVKEHMRNQALHHGVTYPGLKLVEGRAGTRDWSDEKAAATYMEEQGMADFEMYEQKLISPSKFEKQVGKKNVGEKFKELVKQKPGSPQLVKEDDPGIPLKESQLSEYD